MTYLIVLLVLIIIIQHIIYSLNIKVLNNKNIDLKLRLQNSQDTIAERLSLLRIELQKENNKLITAHAKEMADLITAIFSKLK